MKVVSLDGRFATWIITVAMGWLSPARACAAPGPSPKVVGTGVQETADTASSSTGFLTVSLEQALAEGKNAEAREILGQLRSDLCIPRNQRAAYKDNMSRISFIASLLPALRGFLKW